MTIGIARKVSSNLVLIDLTVRGFHGILLIVK
jgi:hypothetical protein